MNIADSITLDEKISQVFLYAVKAVLCLLLLVILAAILWATLKTVADLRAALSLSIHDTLKHVMIDSLTILALLEIFMTTFAYFKEKRVKVTYIIDTVLVVLLTEIMGFWFKEIEPLRIVLFIALVLSLMAARILAIRFSPLRFKEEA